MLSLLLTLKDSNLLYGKELQNSRQRTRILDFRNLSAEDHEKYLGSLEEEGFKDSQTRILKQTKSYLHQVALKESAETWLSKHEFDLFLTVTLLKSIVSDNGTSWYITEENIENTAKFLLRGITRKLAGRRKSLNFAVFLEYQFNGRPHLHILISNPRNIAFIKVQSKIHSVLIETDWIDKEWNLVFAYNQDGSINYSLKTGFNAFKPISCSISNKTVA